jgi:hypothetical protein
MRYTFFHCHNPACGHRLWVPITKRGTRGHCPQCGNTLEIPEDIPEDQFFEGPDILQNEDEVTACGPNSWSI